MHFYKNGTAGAQDGEELSNGDLSNPLVADGFYPAAGVTVSKTLNVQIRADAGEVWHDVLVGIQQTVDTSQLGNRIRYMLSGRYSAELGTNGGSRGTLPFFATLGDTNMPLTITVYAEGSETNSPDTTCKLVAFNGYKEE